MVPGEFGFLYPKIDMEQCVDCHLCEMVCPIDKDMRLPVNQQAYAAVYRDLKVIKRSTSGGAFSAIAEAVLNVNGIVYGVAMDKFIVHHVRIQDRSELETLRGSKYVQSRIGTVFKAVENDLNAKRKVLFSGTPCQVDGLRRYLCKEYEDLITIDIICHGVGSQAYFNQFVASLTRKWPTAKEIRFRSKRFSGWSCSSGSVVVTDKRCENKEKAFYSYENYYYQYFLQGDIYRKSCYSCKYANTNRQGDITLGDFWGVEKLKLPINTYNGCSLVVVNTVKGHSLIREIDNLEKVSVPLKDAARGNGQLIMPSKLREERSRRVAEYEELSGEEIAVKYQKCEKKAIAFGQIKKLIPYPLKLFLRRF